MRTILRMCLVALLAVGLIHTPVFAGPTSAVGVVMQADRAHVGSGAAVGGATLFAGDTVATEKGGMLRARLGTAQVYLPASSVASLDRAATTPMASLQQGTLILSTSGTDALEVHALQATIRPVASQAAYAQITILSPDELSITTQRGLLQVSVGEETRLLSATSTYRVMMDPERQRRRGAGAVAAGTSHFIWIPIAAIAAGTGVAIWLVLRSPNSP